MIILLLFSLLFIDNLYLNLTFPSCEQGLELHSQQFKVVVKGFVKRSKFTVIVRRKV